MVSQLGLVHFAGTSQELTNSTKNNFFNKAGFIPGHFFYYNIHMSFVQIFGNLAFMLVALSFMVKDMLWLRCLSITAALCSITYNSNVAASPLWVPISWNIFFISLNIYHVIKIIYGNRQLKLTQKEQELYEMSFSQLNPIEFAKLIRTATWKIAKTGEVIIKQGQEMENLLMIYNGSVEIIANQTKVNELRDGQFVGEMSYLTNKPASADVVAIHDTEYVCWNQKNLKDLMKRNPSLIFSLQAALGLQLTNVLIAKNQGR